MNVILLNLKGILQIHKLTKVLIRIINLTLKKESKIELKIIFEINSLNGIL